MIADALHEFDDDVVLVGHSIGGLTIPLVAHARPVRKLIFLAGVFPLIGTSFNSQKQLEPDMVLPHPGGPRAARERFYSEASDSDAAWSESQLCPQSQTPYSEITPLAEWPDVDMVSVIPTADRTVNPVWQRKAAEERFGLQPVELLGADHSPFLTRPAELARLLVSLSENE